MNVLSIKIFLYWKKARKQKSHSRCKEKQKKKKGKQLSKFFISSNFYGTRQTLSTEIEVRLTQITLRRSFVLLFYHIRKKISNYGLLFVSVRIVEALPKNVNEKKRASPLTTLTPLLSEISQPFRTYTRKRKTRWYRLVFCSSRQILTVWKENGLISRRGEKCL